MVSIHGKGNSEIILNFVPKRKSFGRSSEVDLLLLSEVDAARLVLLLA